MGQAFDQAKNDDSFYLPPEAFDNPEFKRGLKLFLSADGHAARMTITMRANPLPRGDLAHRRNQELGVRCDQGDAVGGRQDLYRWNSGDVQGHSRWSQVRPVDRGDGRAQPHPAHHDVHHAQLWWLLS